MNKIKDINEKKIVTKKDKELQKEKDKEIVSGIFHFDEVPGGELTFVFRKYKGEPIEKYTLKDGQTYRLPLGVAKHLNNNCWYPVHQHLQDEEGKPSVTIGRKVKRCSFQSLDYTDVDQGAVSDLVSVEQVR